MCAPDCDCKWCVLTEMSMHPLFKDVMDELLEEFKPLFVEMRGTREENRRACIKLERNRATSVESELVALDENQDSAVAEAGDAQKATNVADD